MMASGARVIGDLSLTGRLDSKGGDLRNGSAGLSTAEWSVLYNPATESGPNMSLLRLPPGMHVEGWQDRREGVLMRRVLRMVGPTLPDDRLGYEPRTRENPIMTVTATLEDVPMALHPNILSLINEFSGTQQPDGTVEFPPTLKDGDGKGLLNSDGSPKGNPMWGRKSFKSVGMVVTLSYVVENPRNLNFRVAGTIDEPPSAPFMGNRNWLHGGFTVTVRGNRYEVEEHWILSTIGGLWPDEIYKFNKGGERVVS